jgi:hypothetical protein
MLFEALAYTIATTASFNTDINGITNDDSRDLVLNHSDLVFGIMGVGTFLVGFFALAAVIIFLLSEPCNMSDKIISRVVAVLAFVIVILVLIFSDRQSQFTTGGHAQSVSCVILQFYTEILSNLDLGACFR